MGSQPVVVTKIRIINTLNNHPLPTHTHTHTHTHTYEARKLTEKSKSNETYRRIIDVYGEVCFRKRNVSCCIFFKEINIDGSFHVPEDCHHNFLH